jgi:hypothetical protein
MSFGLCKVPATNERLMETVLRGLTHISCLVYLDDIIVIGRTFHEPLTNLRKVFQWFREDRINLTAEKCQLFQKVVRYLGHIVSPKGIHNDPEKLKAVREWPTPKNEHEVRRFLRLCTYYSRFISGFANIAKQLTKLTEPKQSFQWSPEAVNAFQTLKRLPRFLHTTDQGSGSSST